LKLIDTHCHLDCVEFDRDRDLVWQRACEHSVDALIIPAVTRNSWPKLKEVAAAHSALYPAYGLHPCYMSAHRPEHLDELGQWLDREHPVAVGECGLDFYLGKQDRLEQIALLEAQLSLAFERTLPVILHVRKGVEDAIALLKKFPGLRGVMHSYSGSSEQAKILIGMGFYFGFGGPVTWEQSRRLREVLRSIPLGHLLLETDAPDQSDAEHKGQRNEPAFLSTIARRVAELRDEPLEKVASQTSENARILFSLN
jgi:TatD DNase family protein